MQANEWWLQLRTPSGSHMFYLGVGYPDDGYEPLVDQASALLDFPADWYSRYEAGEAFYRAMHEDPHPSLFGGSIEVHAQGWAEG